MLILSARENAIRWAVGLVAVFSLVFFMGKVEEQYPFSHFPMYGNPNAAAVDYLFLTDSGGEPLSVSGYTGETAAKLKKKWNSELDAVKGRLKVKRDVDLPFDAQSEAARRILEASQALAQQRKTPLPPGTRIVLGLIENTDKGFREKFRVLAELPKP